MLRLIFILIIASSYLYAQSPELVNSFGSFKSAESFDINDAGFIFITDSETNEVHKLSRDGKVIKSIGGYGWEAEAFDNPIHVFATTLNIYISDYNNHRLQIFDKDLNYLSEFSKQYDDENISFGYPMSSGVSSQGDIFILDGDNQRIIKYDLSGNYVTEIGNTDAGEYALNSPTDFAISGSTRLFVTDLNAIKIFDIFGNGLTSLNPGIDEPNISVKNGILTISGNTVVKYTELSKTLTQLKTFTPFELDGQIKDAIVESKFIYILTAKKIYTYKR